MSRLVSKNSLTENQRRCAELLATRDLHGKTHEQIADELGISVRTLYRWKRDPAFVKFKNSIAEEVMEDFLSDAYVQLRSLLIQGKSEKTKLEAIKLVLQNRGKLKDSHEHTHRLDNGKSLEELEAEILEMEKELLMSPDAIEED